MRIYNWNTKYNTANTLKLIMPTKWPGLRQYNINSMILIIVIYSKEHFI